MRLKMNYVLIGTLILFFVPTMGWADTRKVQPGMTKSSSTPKVSNKKPVAIKKFNPKIVVETLSHSPAPLKEGISFKIGITFKNNGLAKSQANAKFKISCSVLSGGGPEKECPIDPEESSFGKKILPGTTHYEERFSKPAKVGRYKVFVSIPGNIPRKNSRPYTFSATLNVPPKVKVQKAPEPQIKTKKPPLTGNEGMANEMM